MSNRAVGADRRAVGTAQRLPAIPTALRAPGEGPDPRQAGSRLPGSARRSCTATPCSSSMTASRRSGFHAALVAELASAPDPAARDTILAAAAAGTADDCSAVLANVTRPDLKQLAEPAALAACLLRTGFPEGTQAADANVFDRCLRGMSSRGTVLQPVSDHSWDGRVRQQIEPVGDETFAIQFRQICLPATRHRPASVGMPARTSSSYTDANPVVAFVLASSVLREAEQSGWWPTYTPAASQSARRLVQADARVRQQ